MYITVKGSENSFLQPEILGPLKFLEVETREGTAFLDFKDVGGVSHAAVAEHLGITEQEVYEVSHKMGYLARTSAPGYLDCTDWVGFTSKAKATEYLRSCYYQD